MADICIRRAGAGDLEGVLALYRQRDFNGEAIDADAAGNILARFESYPFYRLYVAEVGGEIAGSFTILVMDNVARMGTPSAILEAVVVSTRHQGEGIGTEMMRHAFQLAANAGAYKISLSTSSNQAHVHGFYERLGFERHGTSYRLEMKGEAA